MRQVNVIEGTRLPPGAKEALELRRQPNLDLFGNYGKSRVCLKILSIQCQSTDQRRTIDSLFPGLAFIQKLMVGSLVHRVDRPN